MWRRAYKNILNIYRIVLDDWYRGTQVHATGDPCLHAALWAPSLWIISWHSWNQLYGELIVHTCNSKLIPKVVYIYNVVVSPSLISVSSKLTMFLAIWWLPQRRATCIKIRIDGGSLQWTLSNTAFFNWKAMYQTPNLVRWLTGEIDLLRVATSGHQQLGNLSLQVCKLVEYLDHKCNDHHVHNRLRTVLPSVYTYIIHSF